MPGCLFSESIELSWRLQGVQSVSSFWLGFLHWETLLVVVMLLPSWAPWPSLAA